MTRRSATKSARTASRLLIVGLAAAIGLTLATAAESGILKSGQGSTKSEKPTWAAPAKRMPVEGEGTDALEARLQNAEMRVREAMQNAAAADYNYTRARTRRYPRGEALQEIKDRVVEMRDELVAAENDFMSMVDEARAGGVPMGTLMPYMDLSDEIKKNQATRAAGGQ